MHVDGTRGCAGAVAVQNDNTEHASHSKSYTLPFLATWNLTNNIMITTVNSLLIYFETIP